MELFKIFGKIVVDGVDKAKSDLKKVDSQAKNSSESMMSCGVSERVPLYSGYISCLNVPPGGSNATAK